MTDRIRETESTFGATLQVSDHERRQRDISTDVPPFPCGWAEPRATFGAERFVIWDGDIMSADDAIALGAALMLAGIEARR